MSDHEKIWWVFASFAADRIVAELEPHCQRIEVLGSIRRRVEHVGDIELLCIPNDGVSQPTMIETAKKPDDAVKQYLVEQMAAEEPVWSLRKNKKGNTIGFADKNRIMWRTWEWRITTTRPFPTPQNRQLAVDVFMAQPDTWAALKVIRTGCSEWNVFAAQRATELGMRLSVSGGGFTKDGDVLTCESEQQYFDYLKIPYQEPTGRTAEWVRSLRGRK